MYTSKKIEESSLVKDIYSRLPGLVKKLHSTEQDKSITLTVSEEYLRTVQKYVSEITNKIQDLHGCVAFLMMYPKKSKVGKTFSRAEYIIYHLEYYYINMVAIFDRVLRMTNFVYDLGLADKHVSYSIICENSKIPKGLKNLIKRYDKAIHPIRVVQNNIKHKEKYYDRELRRPELIELMLREPTLRKSLTTQQVKTYSGFSKITYSWYISKKKKELIKNNENVEQIICELYNFMHTQHIHRLGQ